MHQRTTGSRRLVRLTAAALVGGVMVVGTTGCNNAAEGAFSGAAIGALAGMGLGSLSGNMGKGAAAGAILGGVSGMLVGDQNMRRDYSPSYHYSGSYCGYRR